MDGHLNIKVCTVMRPSNQNGTTFLWEALRARFGSGTDQLADDPSSSSVPPIVSHLRLVSVAQGGVPWQQSVATTTSGAKTILKVEGMTAFWQGTSTARPTTMATAAANAGEAGAGYKATGLNRF